VASSAGRVTLLGSQHFGPASLDVGLPANPWPWRSHGCASERARSAHCFRKQAHKDVQLCGVRAAGTKILQQERFSVPQHQSGRIGVIFPVPTAPDFPSSLFHGQTWVKNRKGNSLRFVSPSSSATAKVCFASARGSAAISFGPCFRRVPRRIFPPAALGGVRPGADQRQRDAGATYSSSPWSARAAPSLQRCFVLSVGTLVLSGTVPNRGAS